MLGSRWRCRSGQHEGRIVEVTDFTTGTQILTLQMVRDDGSLEPEVYENTVFAHLMSTALVKPGAMGPYFEPEES